MDDETGKDAGQDEQPLGDYDTTPDPLWLEAMLHRRWIPVEPGLFAIGGDCPHCHHRFVFRHPEDVILGVDRFSDDHFPAEVFVRCECRTAHSSDKTKVGCGQGGMIPFRGNIDWASRDAPR